MRSAPTTQQPLLDPDHDAMAGDPSETDGFIEGDRVGRGGGMRRGGQCLCGCHADQPPAWSRRHSHTPLTDPRIEGRHTDAQGPRRYPHGDQVYRDLLRAVARRPAAHQSAAERGRAHPPRGPAVPGDSANWGAAPVTARPPSAMVARPRRGQPPTRGAPRRGPEAQGQRTARGQRSCSLGAHATLPGQ